MRTLNWDQPTKINIIIKNKFLKIITSIMKLIA